MRRVVGAVMGPLCALLIWLMPIGELSGNAHHMLAVMSLVAIWWITEPVPIPVTSLLGPTLCVVLGIAPIKDAFSNFANPLIFLFMGGFLLAKGMMVNGLDKRIAYGILSMNAMMFPIALGLLEAIREMMAQNGKIIDLKNYKYATGLMLMTAYACSIGGVMTPIGTPPNIIMLGFLSELAPQAPTVSFFQWMTWGTVAMIIYFVIAYIVLWRLFPADVKHIEGAEKFISDYVASLGKWTRAQKNTLIAFGVAVFLWVAPSVLSVVYGAHSEVMTFYDKHFPESIAACEDGPDDDEMERRYGRHRVGHTAAFWRRPVDGCHDVHYGIVRLDRQRTERRLGQPAFRVGFRGYVLYQCLDTLRVHVAHRCR